MKAAFITKTGAKVKLEAGHRPKPRLSPGEALVRVGACALNRIDVGMVEGKFPVELPHIPGSDVAGEVAEIKGDSTFKPGDAVVVNPSLPCGQCQPCKLGEPCENVRIFGFHTPGGLAEFVTVPISQIFPVPGALTLSQAAALPVTFLTAWRMLVTRAQVQTGETVFIWGASGGLGVAAVLIAKHLGAKVIAAAGNTEDAKKLESIGANHALDYHSGSLVGQIREHTNGQGVHVVFESVGAATWDRSLDMLRPHGRLVIAGTTGGSSATLDLSNLYFKQLAILGSRMGSAQEFQAVLKLAGDRHLKPIIDSTLPLAQAPQALERLKNSRVFGKIVVTL